MPSFAERRAQNIQANNQELSKINAAKKLKVPKAESRPRPARTALATRTRVKDEEVTTTPRREGLRATRQSSRIAGLDPETPKRKAEDEALAAVDKARQKKTRVDGDVSLGSISLDGKNWQGGLDAMKKLGLGIPARGAQPGVKTFTDEDVKGTSDSDLKASRQRMNSLKLYEKFPVPALKIVPQRIYSMAFHPTEEKPLVFAGDKEGALGMFDASQEVPEVDDEDDDPPKHVPVISALPIHARTITAIHINKTELSSVYTASYDSSIRKIDLEKDISQQILAPGDADEDLPISAIDFPSDNPSMVWFSTIEGIIGKHDLRTKTHDYESWQLTVHKIGGFSLHPTVPHLLATASLDRHMRIWDVRMLGKNGKVNRALVGEHLARLSVSHASWSSAGHVATTSYDDKIRIHSFPDVSQWNKGHELSDEEMEPTAIIPHNCQTGRWVTILKPQWQRSPRDGIQKFAIGNMNRFVDVFDASGAQLAQLDGDGITAVPAVAHFHPTMDWVAGGNASGKLCLWQ